MIACIRIPYFAATLYRNAHPDREPVPLILAQYKGSKGTVYAVCEQAAKAGVQAGMALTRARALCPEAVIEMAAPGQTRRVLDTLLEAVSDYSQWVEVKRKSSQTAVIYVDIGKLMPKEGQTIGGQIIERIKAQGLTASVGLASGKFPAYLAATATPVGKTSLVRRGEEALYLAPFSTAYLPLDTETVRRFQLLGLRKMGQVVALPRPAMIEQFGKLGGMLHRLSSGEDTRRVAKFVLPINKVTKRQFEPPLADRLVLGSVLAAMVSELSAQLLSEGMACKRLLLTLHLENHSEQEIEKTLREPLSSSSPLYRTVQPLLDGLTIRCGITDISLQVSKLSPIQPKQISLFDTQQAEALENVLIDLIDRYGEDRFYRIQTHPHPTSLPDLQFHLEIVEAA